MKWKLVPVEPTDEMIESALNVTAAWLNIQGTKLTVNREKMRVRFAAMLSASPSPGEDVVEAALKQECWDRTGLCRCEINNRMCCTKELELVRAVLKALEE